MPPSARVYRARVEIVTARVRVRVCPGHREQMPAGGIRVCSGLYYVLDDDGLAIYRACAESFTRIRHLMRRILHHRPQCPHRGDVISDLRAIGHAFDE